MSDFLYLEVIELLGIHQRSKKVVKFKENVQFIAVKSYQSGHFSQGFLALYYLITEYGCPVSLFLLGFFLNFSQNRRITFTDFLHDIRGL